MDMTTLRRVAALAAAINNRVGRVEHAVHEQEAMSDEQTERVLRLMRNAADELERAENAARGGAA